MAILNVLAKCGFGVNRRRKSELLTVVFSGYENRIACNQSPWRFDAQPNSVTEVKNPVVVRESLDSRQR
jgi:hypothetical protein